MDPPVPILSISTQQETPEDLNSISTIPLNYYLDYLYSPAEAEGDKISPTMFNKDP